MLRKLMSLLIVVSSLLVAPVSQARAYEVQASPDSFEPDNRYTQAKPITSGVPQTRSIDPKNDVDFFKFQLTSQSAVLLETYGPYNSDTRIRLYKDNGASLPSPIEVNDDAGAGYFSFIDRLCGVDPLPAGIYYLRVEEYLMDRIIPSYSLLFQSSPCPSEVVDIIIGDERRGSTLLGPNGSARRSFTGLNSGPVKVENSASSSIMAAERVIYKVNNVPTSFSEIMALPNSQLHTTYWLPWYNNKDLDTQLRFANVSASTATIHVNIGGQPMAGSPFTLAAGASSRKSFPGVDKGPVKIVSNVPIVAAERVIYKVNGIPRSYSEMMALPDSQLDITYWLPWYNNKTLDTQLRFANVSDSNATVHIKIGGVEMTGSPFILTPGASSRKSFPGIDKGPVKIESNVPIVAAERVIYKVNGVGTSFSEMMALPDSQLDTTYWLPWYNNKDLDTQLRFANVSASDASVHVHIGGVEVTGSPFALAPGASIRSSFPGVDKGPVKLESNVPIVAAERVIYKVNGIGTSFSEMMGLPHSQLDTTFWLPWYNNVELDTQLRFGRP